MINQKLSQTFRRKEFIIPSFNSYISSILETRYSSTMSSSLKPTVIKFSVSSDFLFSFWFWKPHFVWGDPGAAGLWIVCTFHSEQMDNFSILSIYFKLVERWLYMNYFHDSCTNSILYSTRFWKKLKKL